MVGTKEFSKSRNVPDVRSIPISSEDYINEWKNLTLEQIENNIFPELLSPLQQDFKSWDDNLSHLHPKYMVILAKIGVPSSQSLDMNDDVPLCASFMFRTARISQWITKWNKSGTVGKYTDNKQVAAVSVDQLQSDQTGLVPQFSGKLTSTHIWSTQIMVDHFSILTYEHLMRSTTQQKTLSEKSPFERWSTKFGV